MFLQNVATTEAFWCYFTVSFITTNILSQSFFLCNSINEVKVFNYFVTKTHPKAAGCFTT